MVQLSFPPHRAKSQVRVVLEPRSQMAREVLAVAMIRISFHLSSHCVFSHKFSTRPTYEDVFELRIGKICIRSCEKGPQAQFAPCPFLLVRSDDAFTGRCRRKFLIPHVLYSSCTCLWLRLGPMTLFRTQYFYWTGSCPKQVEGLLVDSFGIFEMTVATSPGTGCPCAQIA